MKKNYKLYAIIAIITVAVIAGIIYLVKVSKEDYKLTTQDKKWISANLNNVQNINVLDDIPVFGLNGEGVFYDLLKDLETEHGLKINPITYKTGDIVEGNSFKKVTEYDKNSNIIYTDHFVLISKNSFNVTNITELKGQLIGCLASDYDRINTYFNGKEINLVKYDNIDDLYTKLKENTQINSAIIPLNENINEIISDNYEVLIHLSDLNNYYVLNNDDTEFGKILDKYFHNWCDEHLEKSIKKNQYKIFTNALNLSSVEIDQMNARVYNYGFINQSPYEIIQNGNYGGIVSYYISEFSAFSGLDFQFTKYKNFETFRNAINDGNVDIYYNYYDLETPYATSPTLNYISYDVISSLDNDLALSSINGLKNYDVYALNNSKIAEYLKKQGIYVITYKDNKELFKLNKKDVIIVLDSNIYDYYQKDKLDNYTIRYHDTINNTYNFKIKDDGALYRLFSSYVKTIDPHVAYNEGILNHTELIRQSNIYKMILKYVSFIAFIYAIVWVCSYRLRRRVRVAKRIKKEDKIRYIDQLTLLKNRNYFTENIASWNKNTIYPQAIVIIDLNRVHEINDTLGYEKGDKQIQAAANILIKTQLDNSEIIRTDGNEFMVYCVGYTEKQIASYIRKLNKEFKYLPYEYGATIGKSFIINELKTVDDALNEAIEDMKILKDEQK